LTDLLDQFAKGQVLLDGELFQAFPDLLLERDANASLRDSERAIIYDELSPQALARRSNLDIVRLSDAAMQRISNHSL
jgi:hypothetical protein